jgi:hypothetical protein
MMHIVEKCLKISLVTGFALVMIVPAAIAGPKTKISVLFQDFPNGTQCNASGAQGKVKLGKKRGHPKVDIKGYAEIGTIFCNLPDGRQIITDINKHIRVDARVVGVTLYPNGQAYLTSSTASGLVSEQMANMIRIAN